jgi:hypothetical protein
MKSSSAASAIASRVRCFFLSRKESGSVLRMPHP